MGSSSSKSVLPPLQVASGGCDIQKFCGIWFVIAVKPTPFEKTCSNAVEKYTQTDDSASHDIDIDFTYNKGETPDTKLSAMPQKGYIVGDDKSNSATWQVSPLWPVKMPYLILDVVEDDYTVIGYPSRDYVWIMSRAPTLEQTKYESICNDLRTKHQYDLTNLRKVPQLWTDEERTKRQLTSSELPDSFLNK